MSDWGAWDPPDTEEEKPEDDPWQAAVDTPPPAEVEDVSAPEQPEWPVSAVPWSEYPAYVEPEHVPRTLPRRRSHDPLGRLFPGLSRGTRVTLDWIFTIAGAILIVLAIKHWVVNPYRIPSSSMEPYLNCAKPGEGCLGTSSDRVLACRICLAFSNPSRQDVVVFNTPKAAANACGEGGTFVKRVIGLPGDTVREDNKGFIWIRGPNRSVFQKLNEPYITSTARELDTGHRGQIWHVPDGNYFMMGDNRGSSCDSRQWGPVPRHDLIGTVFFVYWPLDRIGLK